MLLCHLLQAGNFFCLGNSPEHLAIEERGGFAEKVMKLEKNGTGSVIMSGFFPGLSGLMVKKAISPFDEVTEVNVALLQNTNAKAGVAGIVDMLKIIAQPVSFQKRAQPGFTKKRKMPIKHHSEEIEVRLIDHSEKEFVK